MDGVPLRRYHRLFLYGFTLLTLTAFAAPPSQAQNPLYGNVPVYELTGGPWLNTANSQPITMASRRGKVTILHFWTFGCINCQRNLPIYARWQKRYANRDVTVIGIHTPETEEERETENVIRYLKQNGITYPVLIDREGKNWRRWGQRYWPTVYLIDKKGKIRYAWEGELEWNGAGGEAKMSQLIEALLKEEPEKKRR